MIRLIHGNDEFSIANSLKAHLDAIGPDDLLAPNMTVFEAPNARMAEVFAAARIAPFLTERRAIVVKGMLAPMETRNAKVRPDWSKFGDRIADEAMQITNELIFVENAHLRLTSKALKTLNFICRGRDLRCASPQRTHPLDPRTVRFPRRAGIKCRAQSLQRNRWRGCQTNGQRDPETGDLR